jgi:hypothetical protein
VSKPITHAELADALDCFWNAAIGEAHQQGSSEGMAVAAIMSVGFAAVATRLREHGKAQNDVVRTP